MTDAEIQRFFPKINFRGPEVVESPCWVWEGARHAEGYGRFYMNDQIHRAHRIFYELVKGPIPGDKRLLMHRCDNPSCVNPAHLSPGNDLENQTDARAKGRIVGTSRRFSPELAQQIREEHASGVSAADLRRKYGAREKTMRNILRGTRVKDRVHTATAEQLRERSAK